MNEEDLQLRAGIIAKKYFGQFGNIFAVHHLEAACLEMGVWVNESLVIKKSVSLSFLELEVKRRVKNFEKVSDEHDIIDNDGGSISCRCYDCEARAGRILELESLLLVARHEAKVVRK